MRHVVTLAVTAALAGTVRAGDNPIAGDGTARFVFDRQDGAESCPDAAQIRAAIVQRLGFDPFDSDAPRSVACTVTHTGGIFRARIELAAGPAAARTEREIVSSDKDCAELADAVAIALSVALGARPAIRPPATPELAASSRPAQPVRSPMAAAPPAPAPRPTLEALAVTPAPALPEIAPPPSPRSRYTLGGEAGLAIGLGPGPAPSARLFAAVRRRDISLELAGRVMGSSSADFGGGTVEAWLADVSLSPCLHRDPLAVCVFGAAGILSARAEGFSITSETRAPAAVLGARVSLRYPLSAHVAVRLTGELGTPLAIAHLVVDGRDAWVSPRLNGGLGLGVAGNFH